MVPAPCKSGRGGSRLVHLAVPLSTRFALPAISQAKKGPSRTRKSLLGKETVAARCYLSYRHAIDSWKETEGHLLQSHPSRRRLCNFLLVFEGFLQDGNTPPLAKLQ